MSLSDSPSLRDKKHNIDTQATTGAWVTPRSWLFVPATRPERFVKALKTGADAVIIDLEDAVDTTDKQQARLNIAQYVADRTKHNDEDMSQAKLWLRINNNEQLEDDLALCLSLNEYKALAGVVLPKVAAAAQIEKVFNALQLPIVAQIESAQGIMSLDSIAQSEGLLGLSYGHLDIANELNLRAGSVAEHDFFNQLRIRILLTSKAYGLIAPIESIYADFKNEQGMQAVAGYASDLGFSGMLCIHPSQIAIAHHVFQASASQLAFAKKVIAHYQQTAEPIFAIDGIMVDLPLIEQCQSLLQQVSKDEVL